MSDTTTTTEPDNGGAVAGTTPPEASGFDAITSQDEFDRRIADRLGRERAKFADYDALKAKADLHDAAVEAEKSETQKATERATAAEAALAAAEAAQTRLQVIADHQIPKDYADLVQGADQAALEASALKVAALIAKGTPSGPASPALGRADNKPDPVDLDAQIAEAERNGDIALSISLKQQRAFAPAQT